MNGTGFDCDVLVIGLGPVGAAAAALLAQRDLQVIALDRETSIFPLPRAVHFDHEIMRLFQQLGIADEVLPHTRPAPDYDFRSADGELLMRLPPASETASGWAAGYMFHQPSLEGVLRDLLLREGVEVRLGWRFERLTQDGEGVQALVQGPTGAETLRARYLIGCDGACSGVREAIGGELFDYRFDEPWLVVDVKLGPGAGEPETNLQICDPDRPTTCVLGGPGRRRWEFMLLPDEPAEEMLDEAVVRGLIAPWSAGPTEIERKAVYRFHGLVANRWRSGRVLLAGDAAHQTPPFAGQGMCSGLRDAANLTWKLEAVLQGRADQGLLDSYQTEREPHVRAQIELAIAMGRLVCTRDRDAAARRDADMRARLDAGAPPIPPPRPPPLGDGCLLAGAAGAGELFPQPCLDEGVRRLRLDDVLDDRAWLIGRNTAGLAARGVCVLGMDAPRLAPFRPQLEAWLRRQRASAVLVRPDRYIFGTGEARTLLRAWSKAMAPTLVAA